MTGLSSESRGGRRTEAVAKVVVTDHTFPDLALERAILEPVGCEVVAGQGRSEHQVRPLVADADYVITQFAPLTGAVIAAMSRAKGIVRYGIGVDNVDLEAAAHRGIPVFNIPDYCIDEVADHTLALILSLTRQTVRLAIDIRAGRWTTPPPLENFRALRDMTVGVIGCGRIGRDVIWRLLPFKAHILAYDPLLGPDDARALRCHLTSLEQLCMQSDIITLHLPSTAQTHHLINADTLAHMKRGVLLVNVARGAIVDTPALVDALRSGNVGGAALDVTDPEPINEDSPLLSMDNVIITGHKAAASVQADETVRRRVAEIVAQAVRGQPLPPSVNGVFQR